MTISTTTIKNSYNGDGSTTAFTYTFKITDEDHIEVIIRSSNGTETVKTITTHYTVSGVGNAGGGTVTFTAGNIPISGETVILRRDTPQTQGLDLIENDPLPANSLEDAFDKITSITQELQEEVDRSIKLSRTNTMTSTEFAVDASNRANKLLAFDSAGELQVAQEIGTFRGNWSASTSYQVRDLVKDTSTNNIFIATVAHTSSGSQPLTTNTDSAKWTLIVDAASATSSQTAAAASAAAALTSENNSATSEANAATSEASALSHKNDAETAKTASETAQTAAETAQAAAEAALDTFDDRFLGAKATDPTLDNDGNALQDGALYYDTTNELMKVYDLSNTVWRQLALTGTNQTNVNLVAGQISPTNNISTLAGLNTELTNLGTLTTEISNLNTIRTDITQVSTDSADVQTVATDLAGSDTIGTVATDLSGSNTIGTVATNIIPVQNVNTNLPVIQNVNNNLTSVQNFGNVYRISATAPTTSLDTGDLWFDTTNNVMKVYGSGGFVTAASSINGTANRHKFTATSGQTTFTVDDDGNNLVYDAPYLDLFLNGIRLVNGTDFTATSGTSIVLTVGAAANDILEIVAYGTFELANFSIGAANDVSLTGITDGQVLVYNSTSSSFQPGNASSAEVYGFNKDASGNLIVTTTDGGNDNISSSTFANFDDVLFAASGFTFSLSNGELIATI